MRAYDDNVRNTEGDAKSRKASNRETDSGASFGTEHIDDDFVPSKLSAVTPFPAISNANGKMMQRLASPSTVIPQNNFTFFGIFGFYGPPLLALTIVCIVWVMWLITLNMFPNEAANVLTGTSNYDDGEFWLIGRPDLGLMVLSIISLILITLLYAKVLVLLVFRGATKSSFKQQHRIIRKKSYLHRLSFLLRPINDVLDYEGPYRRLWNIGQEVFDITLQATALYRLMESGSLELMYACGALIFCNSISYAGLIMCGRRVSSFTEAVIGLVFDSTVAIGFPMTALFFCYSRLNLDYDLIDLNNEVIMPGYFGRIARLAADPIQTARFLVSFQALCIRRFSDFVVQIALHLSSSYRLIRITETMIYNAKSVTTTVQPMAADIGKRKQLEVPRIAAILFVACAALAFIVPMEAVRYSEAACSHQHECVIFAYRWQRTETCPCIGLVDIERAPKSYEEWLQPKDATETLKELTLSGDLQILKIINRGVRELPEGMAACTSLQQVYLMYTGLMEIPDWANALSNIEILHIEGKLEDTNLVHIPPNFFDNKRRLVFLHLGVHPQLKKLPSFDGLINLRTLTLVQFYSLTNLPTFEKMGNLKALAILDVPKLRTLPSLNAGIELKQFAVIFPTPLCCNGFLGKCELDHPYCRGDSAGGDSQAICLPANASRASPKMLGLFDQFKETACWVARASYQASISVPLKESTEMCGGVMYKECYLSVDAPPSICYNRRLMAISCIGDPIFIELRKKQIQRKIGRPCDPEVESWLGCEG